MFVKFTIFDRNSNCFQKKNIGELRMRDKYVSLIQFLG